MSDLTLDELNEIHMGLLDRIAETQRYLAPSTRQPHEPCCKLEAKRLEDHNAMRTILEKRLASGVSALTKVMHMIDNPPGSA